MPVLIHGILIYVNSSSPYPQTIPDIPFLDKVIHFFVYGLLGTLIFRAIRDKESASRQTYPMILGVIFAALYGISDEIHQSFVPERVADMYDALADILGSICGIWLYQYFIQRYYSSFPYDSHIDKIDNFI